MTEISHTTDFILDLVNKNEQLNLSTEKIRLSLITTWSHQFEPAET